MARKTRKQIENLQQAALWWGMTIDPTKVDLNAFGESVKGGVRKLTCGTMACFGGWAASWPFMREQGVRSTCEVSPHFFSLAPTFKYNDMADAGEVARKLFGDRDLFDACGCHPAEYELPGDTSDYERVMARIEWALNDPDQR